MTDSTAFAQSLPTGTITFLFTDIEGSTKLWQQYPDAMPAALAQHHALLKQAITAHAGYVFQIVGDAFCAAFSTASTGLDAALAAQRALRDASWGETGPIRVRMALHTGTAEVHAGEFTSGEYLSGLTLSRTARLLSAGHGGQMLLSMPAFELVRDHLPPGVTLRDLGPQRLKDLIRPEHIFQAVTADLQADFPALKTLDSLPNNLPLQLTSFVGREKEFGQIKEILSQARLVTLTGAGGSGKTRLALQVAADLSGQFADGVWFVDLAPLADPLLVPGAIAAALNVREEGGRPLLDLLADYVRRRELLIVLDNCEHLVEACAGAADRLLHAAPRLKIIATSREGLGVEGEHCFTVPSLSAPDTFDHERFVHPTPESLSIYESVRLFIDRARAVKNDFAVTNANAPAVAQICHQLDGIPLAIELAAARVNAMTPEQIAARLGDSLRLLTGGSRTTIPRHHTLRAAVDWSWNLLSENERTLLRRLSTFAGGWTLEAAEAIGGGEEIDRFEILDLLTHLISKSLVVWQEEQVEPRYHLLETIRQYARGKLLAAGEEGRVRRQHAEYFARWVEQGESQIYSPLQAVWVRQLDTEQDNLRAALEWAVSAEPIVALRIANTLADYYWYLRSASAEGIRWYERALRAASDAPIELRAYALAYAAHLALHQGRTTPYAEESLRLARQSHDQMLLATALKVKGQIKLEGGDPQGAAASFEEALALARATQSPELPGLWVNVGEISVAAGDYVQAESYFQQAVDAARAMHHLLTLAEGLYSLGHLVFLRGDIDKARTHLTEGLAAARDIQNGIFTAHTSEMLARVHILDKALAEAHALLSQSLRMLQELGMKSCLAHNLEGWARLALAQGEPERAARLMGALTGHLTALGMTMIPLQQALYDQTLAALHQRLDAASLQAEWAVGEKWKVDQAIEYALQRAKDRVTREENRVVDGHR